MATNNLHNLKKRKRKRPAPPANPEKNNYNYEYRIRVGSKYQADIPKLLSPNPDNKLKQRPKSLKLWFPHKNISEVQLNDYILLSKNKYGYETEQSLGLLYWNKHNLEKSIRDLSNFLPHSNWSILDKSNFESAFNKFGKDFENINKMLPDKSLKSIICYYYSWKKKKNERLTSIKPVNKLEHSCANRIQNESTDNSSSTKSEPDNMILSDHQTIGHIHQKIKLDDIVYRNSTLTTNFIFPRWNNGGIFQDILDKIKGIFTIFTTKFSRIFR